MKKILLSLMAVVCAMSMSAKEYILTPSAATTIDPANADVNQYDASATSWLVSQGGISGTSLRSFDLKYLIFQMNLSELEGMTIQKAEMSYDSKCTVSGKNSNVELASINPAWSASTVTWNSLNADAKAVQISAGTGQNVKTSTVNLKENVLNYVKDEAGKTVAFAIYTYTAREQQISNIKLTIDAIDASASVNVNVKYMCGETEVKSAKTIGTKDQAVELSTEEKANFVVGDKKYIYVSDNGASVSAAEGADVIVTVREAAVYNYSVVSSQGGAVVKGTGFEGDNIEVGYPRYQLIDGVLYEAPKTNDSKKRYTVNVALTEDNASVEMSYSQVKEDVVYYQEAENIAGLTEVTYGNVAVRASNALAAKATENTIITNLPAGKYVVNAGVFSSAKTPAYVIKIGVGSEVYEAPVTAVNNSEVKSAEYTLTKTTAVTLFAEGMGDNNALDYIYIQKTGEYVAPDNTIEAGKYAVTATVAKVVENIPEAFEKYVGEYETKATIEGDATSLVITENAEEGIFSGFEIVGDAVEFSADKTITLGGKTFTVRAKDDDAVNGSLAITAGENEGEYKMADADIYYNGVKAATVTNIKMTLVTAPAVADFEDFTVDPETGLYQPEDEEDETCYWNSGDFTFTTYTDDWGTKYYYDFVGTNSKSSEYEGLADQYNSSVGGAKSGDNYVVWYSNYYGSEGIYCPDAMKVSGFYVTNTAWVVDAILNGDGMSVESDETKGKPFGYKGAEDKLTLVVTGYDLEGEETGKVEYTLAEVKDGYVYYVKAWRWVDLTTLGDNVVNVQFAINSTKRSDYGVTTPTYFCMDDFNGVAPEVDADMEKVEITAVQNVSAASKTTKIAKFMKNGKIVIMKNGKQYNVAGQEM